MDILGVLNTIKGKVLDATHFELLQGAYELQDENIKQLKENNSLLKEKNIGLMRENDTLKNRLLVIGDELSIIKKERELEYNKIRNYYENKMTGECFCSACLGNGKRIAVEVSSDGWHCPNCKMLKYF